ncbi:MAG: PadR family transcriptional regulator [Thaumarchaeota archaeon]|nr:PadR family transcriptional regulator [Nitrososphaerota archaeon]
MASSFPRHWTHPQAIPRGFLRIYILTMLSRGPATGYEIMQRIEEKTEGAWRPGPGTIYPLLKSLVREKLVTPSEKKSKTSRVTYTITPAARRELSEMRAGMATFGRKERVIMRLVSDLMPNEILVPILLNRAREGVEFMRTRISALPEPERTAALRELRSITENQLDWAVSSLKLSGPPKTRPKPVR